MRVALIGLGGMGKVVARELQQGQGRDKLELCAVIVSPGDYAAARASSAADIPLLRDIDELLATEPDIVAECASHAAVREYGERILQTGTDLLVISTGVLADAGLYAKLAAAAERNKASLLLPPGAVGGIDALGAARIAGLKKVSYRGRKPALAWQGTEAESRLDLAGLRETSCFFQGSAREAALRYPKNSNVAAAVALAGLGFDATEVELYAEPGSGDNRHELLVEAVSGSFQIQLSGVPLAQSPKTSALAAYSVVKCLLDRAAAVLI